MEGIQYWERYFVFRIKLTVMWKFKEGRTSSHDAVRAQKSLP